MSKSNLWTWIAIVLLTITNYFLPREIGQTSILLAMILFTIVKVFLVSFQFMEMKRAHSAWSFLITFVVLIYAGFIIYLKW